MAVSWIKIEVVLPDKQEVIAMARMLKFKDTDMVVGKLIRLWAWADLQTVDGECVMCTDKFIDRMVFCNGFAKALRSVGWLTGEDGALGFPNFERHNGETAKARAESARRMAKSREAGGQQNGNGRGNRGATDMTDFDNFSSEKVTGNVAENVQQKPQRKPQPEGELEFNSNKGGGGEIPRCMGETGAGVKSASPPPPVFPDQLQGADGKLVPEFVGFVEWVKGVRPGWDVGKLSRREQQAAARAFLALQRPVSELERVAVAEYLAHEPDNGKKFDYPPDRELFLTIFQEVVQKAVAWFRRTGRKTPAEREADRKRALALKLRNEEGMARRLAKQFQHSPEEVVTELNALREKYGEEALNNNELDKIMKGDYEG